MAVRRARPAVDRTEAETDRTDRQRPARAGTGRVGTGATLLAQLDVARFSFLANAGMTYQPNRQGDLTSIWAVSGAAIYKATDKLQIVADIGTSRHTASSAGANPPS